MQEGGTTLYLPRVANARGPARRARVFYNPVMAFDRDLNVAFARAIGATGRTDLAGWEMLGATGVRGLRLAHETELLGTLLITEREAEAVGVIERNVEELHLPRVRARPADARVPPPEGPFDYVDLDPYGSPLPYLDAMFRSVRLPAVVAVTATDLMVLAGIVRGACEARYGARPLHGRLAPEGGLRILIATLAREARAHHATLTPLLSYVHDHHVRTYAELVPSEGARTTDPVASVDPATWTGPPLGAKGPYGPFWVGPLFDRRVVDRLQVPPSPARPKEIHSWVERFRAEAEVDQAFFYEPNEIARTLHLTEPPPLEALLAGLRARGTKAARAHPQASALRTDAPRTMVEAVARSLAHRA